MEQKTTEWEAVTQAMKQTSNKRMYERYLAIRLRLDGHTFNEIAEILGRIRQTISEYWTAYQKGGLEALKYDVSPGRPSILTEEQTQLLAEVLVSKRPDEVGFEAKATWTLKLISAWIEQEFGHSFTPRGVSMLLHRLGFSFTKATYTLARANEEEQAEFVEKTFPSLKKQLEDGDIDHLLFEDESSIRDYQALHYNWFLIGQQHKVPTYGQHKGAKLFGAINYETGHVTHMEDEIMDAEAFQRFLEKVLHTYPTGKMVMVLDNSRIHHSAHIQPFLDKHPRLRLVFLPAYSPELNLIEGLWKWVKGDVINNVFFAKFYHIKLAVKKFMRRINANPQETIDRLLVRM